MVRAYHDNHVSDSLLHKTLVTLIGCEELLTFAHEYNMGSKSWTGDYEKATKQSDGMVKEFEMHPMKKVDKGLRQLSGLGK